ncbi:hypothetical protein SteCoe_7216 [Stentor coeruleus]|uniref:Uncharacterized protein n=1 Tax=Stentor coeruleus TaxID=5963 RepID=A0A1R2CN52_9CILI|nr:hypothetical protein SteCoe_7216 [Stentor coeruleus]
MENRRKSYAKNKSFLVDISSTDKFIKHKRLSEDVSHVKLPPMSTLNKSISFVNASINNVKIRKPSMDNSYVFDTWNKHLASKPLRNQDKLKIKYRNIKRINVNPRLYTDNVEVEVNERMYERRMIKIINELMF